MILALLACAAEMGANVDEHGVPRADLAGCAAEYEALGAPVMRTEYDDLGHVEAELYADDGDWLDANRWTTTVDELGRPVERVDSSGWTDTWEYVEDTWQIAGSTVGEEPRVKTTDWAWSEDRVERIQTDADGDVCTELGVRGDGVRILSWSGDCRDDQVFTWEDDRRVRHEESNERGSWFIDATFDDAGRLAELYGHSDASQDEVTASVSWSCP